MEFLLLVWTYFRFGNLFHIEPDRLTEEFQISNKKAVNSRTLWLWKNLQLFRLQNCWWHWIQCPVCWVCQSALFCRKRLRVWRPRPWKTKMRQIFTKLSVSSPFLRWASRNLFWALGSGGLIPKPSQWAGSWHPALSWCSDQCLFPSTLLRGTPSATHWEPPFTDGPPTRRINKDLSGINQ